MNKSIKYIFVPLGVIALVTALILPNLVNCDELLKMSAKDQQNYLTENTQYRTIIQANQDCNNAIPNYQLGLGIIGFISILSIFIIPMVFPNMEYKEEEKKK